MDNTGLAPIVLFVYNRLEHTKATIEALKSNYLAKDSIIYIFSDAGKYEDDQERVVEVRKYIKDTGFFKESIIIERECNYGLARNIIEGLSYVFQQYDTAIILEDDIVTSECFLEYMNLALGKYKKNELVMAISAYIWPIKKEELPEYFFLPWFGCWGWATWKDRWDKFRREPSILVRETSYREKRFINVNGNAPDMWCQVVDNYRKRKLTWAIFFYITICKNKGLVLYPRSSKSRNIGNDGSGSNCENSSEYDVELDHEQLNIQAFPDIARINEMAARNFERFCHTKTRKFGIRTRIIMFAKMLLF